MDGTHYDTFLRCHSPTRVRIRRITDIEAEIRRPRQRANVIDNACSLFNMECNCSQYQLPQERPTKSLKNDDDRILQQRVEGAYAVGSGI